MPDHDKLYGELKNDAVVPGISDESEATVKKFLQRARHEYPQGLDSSNKVASSLQVQGIPHVIVNGVFVIECSDPTNLAIADSFVNTGVISQPWHIAVTAGGYPIVTSFGELTVVNI